MASTSPPPEGVPEGAPSSGVRSFVTLFLMFHLFCLVVAMATNAQMSSLRTRLLRLVSPYTQSLRLELTFAPVHLTQGMEMDDDHFVEVEILEGPRAGQTIRLPDNPTWSLTRDRRYISLAKVIAANAYMDRDDNCSEFALAIGANVLARGGDQEAVVRVKRRRFQPYNYQEEIKEHPADPYDAKYESVAYEANVKRDREGNVHVIKVSSKEEVAPIEKGDDES